MVLITSPPDPAKILLLNTTIEAQGKARTASALLVARVVLAIPIGAALVGGPLLNLLGINLDAFSFVGRHERAEPRRPRGDDRVGVVPRLLAQGVESRSKDGSASPTGGSSRPYPRPTRG
ncbi:MAG: hypothetical protein PVG27_02375 [Chloroflexota bacterium]|jgi:hypothetical protein